MKMHFALPGLDTYLDRAHAFAEADPGCTVWTLKPPGGHLPAPLRGRVRAIGGRWRVRRPVGQWMFRWALRDVHRQHPASVLYSSFGLFDRIHAHARRRPNVLNVHVSVAPSWTWFDDATVPPAARDAHLAALRNANVRMELRAAAGADCVVVQAAGHVPAFARATGRPPSDFAVVPNAAVARAFMERGRAVEPWLEVAESRPALLFVGNMWRYKGVLDLLHAFATVSRDHERAVLLMVGRAPTRDMDAEIQSLIRELALDERVHRIPHLPQAQCFTLMRAARGLVLPSHYEGMPRVVLESMDLGTPAVAADIPGTRAIDPAGDAIFFHEPGDRPGLAARLGQVLDGGPDVRQCAAAGRELIEQNHRPAVVGRRIRQTCEQALARKGG